MGSYIEEGCEYAFYDFGTVSTGTQAYKTVTVSNYRTVSQCYEITGDPDTNPLNRIFQVIPSNSTDIEPGCSFTFNIEYSPIVPFTISYDYFNISDAYGVCCKFGVKGKSLGPLVECSTRELVFTSIGLDKQNEKTIFLSNESADIARFQFDIDEMHIFQVSPMQGIIEPRSQLSVTIKFTAYGPGIYSRYLYCLIQFQSPLMIDVVGFTTYNESLNAGEISLKRFIYQEGLLGGFESYVSDSKTLLEQPPPIVLSENYIDFGKTDVNKTQATLKTVSVTSYIKGGCYIDWERDSTGIFLIEPMTTRIPCDGSALLEVYFRPNEQDKFYSREFAARIHWDEKTTHDSFIMNDLTNEISVPFAITLRLMGHTFAEESAMGNPEYNIFPACTRMPPCMPPVSVYNTLSIEKVGNSPLMFKFIPPTISRYVVKPMQGVIYGDFQIIVVGVCPDTKEETTYFESWTLQINGSKEHKITLEFGAYTEYPKILVGDDNVVVFPPTFPGTERNGQICMKNFTRHYIWYRFSLSDATSELWLLENEGAIASNEIAYITWQFVPNDEGPKLIHVNCDTCALLDCWLPHGTFVSSKISVYTESEYTELVSFPNEFNCGLISYHKVHEIQFHLFNFGRCKLNFILKCISYDEETSFVEQDIELNPSCGKIEPHENTVVSVKICPSELGEHTLAVAYDILEHSKSSLSVLEKPIAITVVRYECVLSQLQIADIDFIGSGPIFSKVWLWRMMNINSLNSVLHSISPSEKHSVQIDVPHALMNSMPLTIYVQLRNISEVKASWKLRRLDTCSCVMLTEHMTRTEYKNECSHRDQISISPLSAEQESNEETVVTVIIKYIVSGQNEVSYQWKLGNDRTVIISFIVVSLPPDICSPSVYSTALTFQGTYIGDHYPNIEAYWLYNSVCQPAYYYIDLNTLKNYNNQKMYDVITCVNPSGIVPPQSSHPILFQFTPKALDSYTVNVPICLGTQYFYNLCLKGDGIISYQDCLQAMSYKAPRITLFDIDEIPVYLSVDHILVGPILTHSLEERIFFLENRCSNRVMGYCWQKYHLPDFLTCAIEPSKGKLDPGESQVFKLTIRSHSQPSLLTIHMPCELMNFDLRYKHEQAEVMLAEIIRRTDEVFIITEKGMTKPMCKLNIPQAPSAFYRVLAVSCNVISTLQVDEKMSLYDQLKLFPPDETKERCTNSTNNSPSVNVLKVVRHVIDALIWDTIFSTRFWNVLKHIKTEDSVYYGQFIMDPKEEKRLVALAKHAIPRNVIASILRQVIWEIFEQEYNSGQCIPPEISVQDK